MKHPGFLRLISALYMLAPRFRLLLASFEFHLVGLGLLRSDVDFVVALGCRGELRRVNDRWRGRRASLAQRAVPEHPRDRAHCDQREPCVKQLQRAPDLRSSARRTGPDPALRKPGQTTCVALPEALGKH